MHLPDFLRTTTFRWTLAISAAVTMCIVLMFGLVYWQVSGYATALVDRLDTDEAETIRAAPAERAIQELQQHLRVDPLRVKLGGLFDPQGDRIAGNIERLPPALSADEIPHTVSLKRLDGLGPNTQVGRGVARRLADGRILVVARKFDEFWRIESAVRNALALGLIPALCLGLAAGTLLSLRAQKRLDAVTGRIRRIMAGDLRERLPARRVNDPFDRLAVLVNDMLEEIQALVETLAGVGDDIAHDLRTPLTRVRVSLERARHRTGSLDDLRASVDQAIGGLDQSLAIITALLRIADIEHSRRQAGFAEVDLADLVREVGELYEPIAEDKGVAFEVDTNEAPTVRGDRDLLFEAIANLVDNAVKFTPSGGRLALSLLEQGDDAIVRVRDTGPGIEAKDHDLVGRRFYRSDKSRGSPGLGLGLSLVHAIAKLHGFRFSISAGRGCVAEIAGGRQRRGGEQPLQNTPRAGAHGCT
ncbi:MAG: HAMP domain-containing histidine kinase [Acetobacteraceae bacterium]|nr:HAMP domain-containing histidine kinase [Acetobacteraceae bacterium]